MVNMKGLDILLRNNNFVIIIKTTGMQNYEYKEQQVIMSSIINYIRLTCVSGVSVV